MPNDENWIRYRFESNGFDPATFQVYDFEGFERISAPYEFTINVTSEEPEIDLALLSQEGARFVLVNQDDEERVIHGVLAECHETGRGPNDVASFRVVLVPRMWLMSLQRQNQVHQDQDIAQTLEEELIQSGFAKNDDFAIRLSRTDYPVREYIVQYDETDLNFICRQMEHYGICFFFEQGDDKEKLIIADDNQAFPKLAEAISFVPPSGQAASREAVASLICTQNRMPEKVILNDYNHRTPSVGLKVEHPVSPNGKGIVSNYGDHFKTRDDGKVLAEVRAQEILATEKIYRGTSSVMGFTTGQIYTLEEHPRSDVNGKSFLITSIQHEGIQPGAYESGEGSGEAYSNSFESIPSDTAYRPPRDTVKPKLYGVLNAKVDAAGSGEYAEVNDQGQYKVKLPFDLTGKGDAQASRFVRKAEPYAGPGYGQHFPLHSDCEVLLTCIDGDPDRPIISGAVPNPEMASPVNSSNQKTSVIRTGGGNFIELDDTAGSERIKMTCPQSETYFHLGAPNQGEPGLWAASAGLLNLIFGDVINTHTDSDRNDTTTGNATNAVDGTLTQRTTGNTSITNEADVDWKILGGNLTKTIGTTNEIKVGQTNSLWVGNKNGISASADHTETIGTSIALKQALSLAHTFGLHAHKDDSGNVIKEKFQDDTIDTFWKLSTGGFARHSIGAAYIVNSKSYVMDANTTIDLKGGSKVTIDGGGATIEVKAGEVNIKCGKLKCDGDLKVTGNAYIDGKLYDC